MEIKPITNEADYQSALKEIEFLMTVSAGSSEGERLVTLVTLVESHEAKRFPAVENVADSASRPNR